MESAPKVQHVTKASSDQILRKFAEMDSESDTEGAASARKSMSKRRRLGRKKKDSNKVGDDGEEESIISPSKDNSFWVVEKKSLLPNKRVRRSSGALLRQLGISRSHLRGCRDFRHKSVLGAIEKTWSKAVRGASKVFMEKHYNRHRILIDDAV